MSGFDHHSEAWQMHNESAFPTELDPVMADPARCGYCDGPMERPTLPGVIAVNMLARRCTCGRRHLEAMGNGYELVHRDGCEGVSCDCWDPHAGLGDGAAMVTPTGRRTGRPYADDTASSDPPTG